MTALQPFVKSGHAFKHNPKCIVAGSEKTCAIHSMTWLMTT